jgi:flagellar motor switch protein FliG
MAETLATVTSIAPSVPPTAARAQALDGITGRRKAAILVLQLDPEASAKVLAELRESELEELAAEMARAGAVSAETAAAVLFEFGIVATSARSIVHGGMDQTRELLIGAVGERRANEILDRLPTALLDMPFKFLQNADSRQLLSFISDEHPQTIALVLAHVPAPLASKVLAGLGADLQADVAHRIATMDRTSPDIIRQVEASLERRMATLLVPADLSAVGGVQPLVEIINRADRVTERLILEGLEERDPELADEVRSRMFVFEDLVNLDDRAVQMVLRQVDVARLAVALKGVAGLVHAKVVSNMSERAAATLVEEIELLGPVRVQSVEEAQSEVVRVIRALEESGEIVLRRGEEDEFVA